MSAFTAVAFSSKIELMIHIGSTSKLPAYTTAGSFLLLLIITLFSSPINQVALTLTFFGVLLVFLVSLSVFIASIGRKKSSNKTIYKATLLSIFIVIILMFNSSQSLSLENGLILVLVIAGIVFYADRRIK